MKILVACEYSGIVRDAFIRAGHDAWSCDLLPCESSREKHIVNRVERFLSPDKYNANKCVRCLNTSFGDECFNCGGATISCRWDLMIAFPPCTHLCVSGARWFSGKRVEQACAVEFVRLLMNAPIERIAIENPVGVLSTFIRKPDQIIQPWQFGHGETKATCLWLRNLPPLMPANVDDDLFAPPTPAGREPRVWRMPPGANRWKERSRTLPGIAAAMAEQWGAV